MAIDAKRMQAFVDDGGASDEEVPEQAGEQEPDDAWLDRYAKLLIMLEEYIDVVIEVSDEMDEGTLTDPKAELAPDDIGILVSGLASLDRRLSKELQASAKGLPIEVAEKMAAHLEGEGMIEDAERVAGWLFRVGQYLAGPAPEEGEGEESEEELDEEELGEGAE